MNYKILLFLITYLVTIFVKASEEYDESNVTEDKELNNSEILCDYQSNDLIEEYDVDKDVLVNCDDGSCVINGEGAVTSAGFVNITSAGTYIIQGSVQGQVFIDAPKEDFVHLVLEDTTIFSKAGPAIYGSSAEKITITVIGNTTIIDPENHIEDDDDFNACVFVETDLSINGSGTLTITGNYGDAVRCKKDVRIINATIDLPNATSSGIKARNSLCVKDSTIDITSVDSAIKVTRNDDETKGYIIIDNGQITITTTRDGIRAQSRVIINSGLINIMESNEGIEAQMVDILGGEIHIISINNGINASKMRAGEESEDSNDEDVNNSSEVEEGSTYINIAGGKTYITVILMVLLLVSYTPLIRFHNIFITTPKMLETEPYTLLSGTDVESVVASEPNVPTDRPKVQPPEPEVQTPQPECQPPISLVNNTSIPEKSDTEEDEICPCAEEYLQKYLQKLKEKQEENKEESFIDIITNYLKSFFGMDDEDKDDKKEDKDDKEVSDDEDKGIKEDDNDEKEDDDDEKDHKEDDDEKDDKEDDDEKDDKEDEDVKDDKEDDDEKDDKEDEDVKDDKEDDDEKDDKEDDDEEDDKKEDNIGEKDDKEIDDEDDNNSKKEAREIKEDDEVNDVLEDDEESKDEDDKDNDEDQKDDDDDENKDKDNDEGQKDDDDDENKDKDNDEDQKDDDDDGEENKDKDNDEDQKDNNEDKENQPTETSVENPSEVAKEQPEEIEVENPEDIPDDNQENVQDEDDQDEDIQGEDVQGEEYVQKEGEDNQTQNQENVQGEDAERTQNLVDPSIPVPGEIDDDVKPAESTIQEINNEYQLPKHFHFDIKRKGDNSLNDEFKWRRE
ncbi:hypothetical protein PIROE2DRAFT_12371 [Piromyces sp. E2]|nr:hypothetical protein PIROE2DRAFT_12371 [Piromyces sp. E2]|eukprot:OUM61590.1 hypothetical protein PIROE2DRAFT_12371 [Piromyces sp. E2]